MPNPYSLDSFINTSHRIWATRDGCYEHYPRRCPAECPNAGKHDPGLADIGACDCRECAANKPAEGEAHA